MKSRILFVDDESSVLDGLQNILRRERRQWEMVFAVGSPAALEALGAGAFDVIVSDMRMPVMDGAALLAEVKARSPETIRIVLSGHAEQEALVRVMPVAHQFLSKPCDVEALRGVLARACHLRQVLSDDGIRKVAGAVDRLPSAPQVYWDLVRAAGDPRTSATQLGEIVGRDPAMVTKVLQLVNSAYFGLSQPVTSIARAVTYLGVEMLKGLALNASLFSATPLPAIEGFSVDLVQRRALLAARMAGEFLRERQEIDAVTTAALVHDVGQVVLAMAQPERFGRALRQSRETGKPLHQVERAALGTNHAAVGAYLLGAWGLPLQVVEAVAQYHEPSEAPGGPGARVLAALHVATLLAQALLSGQALGSTEDLLARGFLERAGVSPELPRWYGVAEARARRLDEVR